MALSPTIGKSLNKGQAQKFGVWRHFWGSVEPKDKGTNFCITYFTKLIFKDTTK